MRTSPDQSRLVVNDPPTTWVGLLQILEDGSLVNGGLSLLYVATEQGVQVFDPSGRATEILKAPGSEAVTNVLFGGPGLQCMYVSDGNRMYRKPVKRREVGPLM